MQPANRYTLDQVRLLTEIVQELESWPAELQAFEFQHELFGCWYLTIRRNGKRTRFSFDGKDGYLTAQRLLPSAGDFTMPPKGLGGMGLDRGLNDQSFGEVLEFMRLHTS